MCVLPEPGGLAACWPKVAHLTGFGHQVVLAGGLLAAYLCWPRGRHDMRSAADDEERQGVTITLHTGGGQPSEAQQVLAAALSKGAVHAPLLLGIVTGGSGLLFPTSSLGAPTLAAPRRLAECGRSWGNYVLASSGAADCTGCGEPILTYGACAIAAALRAAALGVAGLGGSEYWEGPAGCHVQDGSNFQFNSNMDGGAEAGHTARAAAHWQARVRCRAAGVNTSSKPSMAPLKGAAPPYPFHFQPRNLPRLR